MVSSVCRRVAVTVREMAAVIIRGCLPVFTEASVSGLLNLEAEISQVYKKVNNCCVFIQRQTRTTFNNKKHFCSDKERIIHSFWIPETKKRQMAMALALS